MLKLDVTEQLVHEDGLPAWTLEPAGYPALHSGRGQAAVTWLEDTGIGTVLNLHVDVVSTADNALLRRFDLLSDREFRAAALEPDPAARERALRELAVAVQARVREVNVAIAPSEWQPLERCEDPVPSFWEAYPQGLTQSGRCRELYYRYQRAAVHLARRGKSVNHHLPRLRGAKDPSGVPLLDGLSRVYADGASSLLLLDVAYGAAGGGDAHGQPERWQVVQAP